jgi:phage terminase small subunit
MLTQKQELFTLNLFNGMSQREAYVKAGYSANSLPATIGHHACVLAASDKVVTRLAELRAEAKDDTIADVRERQQILTEIARGNLLDYQEVGADGGYLNIGKESPNTRAISEITSRTEYNNDGAGAAVVVKVKLHSPTAAIDLLNKMDGIYEDKPAQHNLILVNRVVINENGHNPKTPFKEIINGNGRTND